MQIAIYKTSLKSTCRVVYVGQTTYPENVGTKYFGSGIHKLFNLKYIRGRFVSEIITTTENQNEANDLERYYIEYFCTLEEYGGFNIAHGGLGLSLPGEKNPMYGKQHNEESKQKMRENRADVSGENNPMYGKHQTEETKQKMSGAKKGENNPKAKKCVYNGIEFGSKIDAYNYAKVYCGYTKSYRTFCNQLKAGN